MISWWLQWFPFFHCIVAKCKSKSFDQTAGLGVFGYLVFGQDLQAQPFACFFFVGDYCKSGGGAMPGTFQGLPFWGGDQTWCLKCMVNLRDFPLKTALFGVSYNDVFVGFCGKFFLWHENGWCNKNYGPIGNERGPPQGKWPALITHCPVKEDDGQMRWPLNWFQVFAWYFQGTLGWRTILLMMLMAEIPNNHLGCIKPCK